MLYFKQVLLLAVFLGVLHGEPIQQENSEFNEEIISAILKYLSEHNSYYVYKSGRVVQSFLKGDKLEVTSDVDIICDYPCTGGTLRCDSVLRLPSNGGNWLVAGTVCAPLEPYFDGHKLPPLEQRKESNDPRVAQNIVPEINKNIPYLPSNDEEGVIQENEGKVRLQVPCVGCPLDIDTQSEGVNKLVDAALRHVESEHNEKHVLVKVLRVQQQVVAGIKYTLLIEIAPTICHKNVDLTYCPLAADKNSFICEVQYWEKPWESTSSIIKNNCTTSQEYTLQEPVNTTKKPARREMQPDFMSELESQIIPEENLNEIPQELPKPDNPEVFLQKRSVGNVPDESAVKLLHDVALKHLNQKRAQMIRSSVEAGEKTKYNLVLLVEKTGKKIEECTVSMVFNENTFDLRVNKVVCDNAGKLTRDEYLPEIQEDVLAEMMFNDFIKIFRKNYAKKGEYNYRLKMFKNNLEKINVLNKYEQGTAHYGVNKFADLTSEEFSRMNGFRMDLQNENEIPFPEAEIPDIEIPVSFDWREKNAVTEVKNQGMCGSCWAFSTTGNIEGQYAIKHKRLQEFSEQELVDCDKLDDGCNGGLMDNAYRTIEKLGGLESEKDYPYDAEDEKCHFNKSKVIVRLSGALNISTDEGDMAKWLTQNGPISIAINANAMQFYAGGVSHPFKILCNPKELDHGVLIVGYGVHKTSITKKTLPFWIVKNSWGETWGEQGYYRVYRGDGTCGVNQTPSSAIVV